VETAVLREDRGFVLQGAILEMECQPVGNLVPVGCLRRVAIGNSCTIQGAQEQKPPYFAFRLAYRDCRWGRGSRVEQTGSLEQRRPGQHDGSRGAKPEIAALMSGMKLPGK